MTDYYRYVGTEVVSCDGNGSGDSLKDATINIIVGVTKDFPPFSSKGAAETLRLQL